MGNKIQFRELRKNKYELLDDYFIDVDIHPSADFVEPLPPRQTYIRLDRSGRLAVLQVLRVGRAQRTCHGHGKLYARFACARRALPADPAGTH